MSDPLSQSPQAPGGFTRRPGPASVLVLEDSDDDFDTVREAFLAGGYDGVIRRATSGDECLELLRQEFAAELPPVRRPAVVLMDLNVPGLDGRDALQEIKSDERLRTLPVVVHTTSTQPGDLTLCYRRGANAYHVKPLSYPQHLDVLRRVFHYWLKDVVRPDGSGAGRDRV